MCKTLKGEVHASSHIPLTPRGLVGVQGAELPEAFWFWSFQKANEANLSKICTFFPTIIFRDMRFIGLGRFSTWRG